MRKLNICLNVVCRRDDGYHELEMIMVPLMLHDELTITLSSEDCYTCSDAQLRWMKRIQSFRRWS